MNVVVIEETPGEYAAIGETLRKAGYATQIVALANASATLASEMPDVTVVGCRKGVAQLQPLSKALGALEDSRYRALIAVVDGDTAGARATASEGGADDMVLSTASPAEVLDHVKQCAAHRRAGAQAPGARHRARGRVAKALVRRRGSR